MLSTTESGAQSSSTVPTISGGADGDDWAPTYGATSEPTRSGGADLDGPTLTFESANGHAIVLTYHDMVMLALLGTLAAAAWRGVR